MPFGESIALNIFPALMIYAGLSDLFSMKISNWISVCLVVIFFPLAYLIHLSTADLIQHALCGLLVLVVTFFFFARSWIGGGDAKIASATAVWFGWSLTLEYALLSAIIGGVLTLGILLFRRQTLPAKFAQKKWIARLYHPATGIPYGIALSSAAFWLYPQSEIWVSLVQK